MSSDNLINDILQSEGGYSDRAADKGGPTNFGITISALSAWIGAPVTKQDIINLTKDEARALYRDRYVAPWSFIEDEPLRDLLVDWSVTSGQVPPTKALQTFMNGTGAIKVDADGQLGNKTRQAWAALLGGAHPEAGTLPTYAQNEIAKARVIFYARIALDTDVKAYMAAHPKSQLHNLVGWLNRALQSL